MNNIAIRVDGLGKKYRRGVEEHGSLIERLRRGNNSKPFWALQDVSFEVKQGEALGLIGQNGAGKSTLLKLLSRITRPTTGQADIYGRVGSLLEVGTGFHGELTGRENVYLNGAILGMTKTEVDRKFDEIVEFSGVEKAIDTPVKRYSSGMGVRLAFSVAAHLEPEVLLIDEVLAVGDAAFRKKCLEKMGAIADEGRTIIFISHNMVALQTLCERAIWLDDGRIKQDGEALTVVSNYLQENSSTTTERVWNELDTAPGNDAVRLRKICVRPLDGTQADMISMETAFDIEVEFWNLEPDAQLHITLHLYTEQQLVAFSTGGSKEPTWGGKQLPAGLFRSVCHVPGNLLNSGLHRVQLLVIKDRSFAVFKLEDAISFEVHDLKERQGGWYGKEPGAVRPLLEWTTEYVRDE